MTKQTAIIGIGATEVGEHWDQGIRELAAAAGFAALEDAGLQDVDAVFVGNAYASTMTAQTQLAPLIADFMGLAGVEAVTVENAEASGGSALRMAHLAVLSGSVRRALVIGVEKVTDVVGPERTRARAVSLDSEYEALQGATLPALAALLMRRYMYEYGVELDAFEVFSRNAHANGSSNPRAMFRNVLREGSFAKAPMVADPVNLFDGAPDGDGAAAVVIAPADEAADLVPRPVRILGSAAATDTLTLQERPDFLWLRAVERSTSLALAQAALSRESVDLYELQDSFTILSVLALEAAGFAERGQGTQFAQDGVIERHGELPIATFGGMKARGNPAGAAGVYQAVEAVLQVRAEAGDNQIPGAQTALIQNVAGLGSVAISHILKI